MRNDIPTSFLSLWRWEYMEAVELGLSIVLILTSAIPSPRDFSKCPGTYTLSRVCAVTIHRSLMVVRTDTLCQITPASSTELLALLQSDRSPHVPVPCFICCSPTAISKPWRGAAMNIFKAVNMYQKLPSQRHLADYTATGTLKRSIYLPILAILAHYC